MPALRVPAARTKWDSPVSVGVLESAAAVRAALEELGWPFERKKSTRLYSKFTIALMIPRAAYVFQFRLTDGSSIVIDTWEAELSSSAQMTWISIEGFTEQDIPRLRQFLEAYRAAAGQEPWEFAFGSRVRAGVALPEFRRARRAWAAFGFDTTITKRKSKKRG